MFLGGSAFLIRIPPRLKNKLAAVAAGLGISVNQLIIFYLSMCVEDDALNRALYNVINSRKVRRM